MSCKDEYELIMYADGVELPRPRNDYGCAGETRRYSVTTTIPLPVSYRWTIDNSHTIVSAVPYLDFTFDGLRHDIVCNAENPFCGIGIAMRAWGKSCVECSVLCKAQVAKIPEGGIVSLIDETGKVYPLDSTGYPVCKDNSNVLAATQVKRAIRAKTNCRENQLRVAAYNNGSGRACISLTITNSPIRFKYVIVGSTKYAFDTTNC